jgi:microcompartment protein CcmK/EutM
VIIARIVGNAIAAHCHRSLSGKTLLLCQQLGDGDVNVGAPFVAIDLFGAGLHERVLVSTDGLGARHLVEDDSSPIRMFVQGIVDEPVEDKQLISSL